MFNIAEGCHAVSYRDMKNLTQTQQEMLDVITKISKGEIDIPKSQDESLLTTPSASSISAQQQASNQMLNKEDSASNSPLSQKFRKGTRSSDEREAHSSGSETCSSVSQEVNAESQEWETDSQISDSAKSNASLQDLFLSISKISIPSFESLPTASQPDLLENGEHENSRAESSTRVEGEESVTYEIINCDDFDVDVLYAKQHNNNATNNNNEVAFLEEDRSNNKAVSTSSDNIRIKDDTEIRDK